jgi:hypothetical protein
METTSDIFNYSVYTYCGIPYVMLEGEPSDWKWILDHLDYFRDFGLDFWVERLTPIIDNMHESSMGNIDQEFWQDMYKWHQQSGGNIVNGWITDMFLYVFHNDTLKMNDLLKNDKVVSSESDGWHIGLRGENFTSGLSKVGFKWNFGTPGND